VKLEAELVKYMRFILILFISLTLQQDKLVGFWIISTNDLIIECYEKNDKYYGKIHWFKDNNPDKKKYSENGVIKSKWNGFVVMSDFTYIGDRLSGKIYDVKNGQEYDAYIEINGDRIKVITYVFLPIFGKEMEFRRYKK
jgi:hypothetical protein